jgi:ferredoxin
MATKIIADLCINCGACESNSDPKANYKTPSTCPQGAITDGSDVGIDGFYIHPDLCNECVGHFKEEHCISVCPVDGCIITDPDLPETEEVLIERALKIHPTDMLLKKKFESGEFPSVKRKSNVLAQN